jgi:hypothetical protein|tara:strand:- start:61 stop:492 length:432 start_codon:yes stop_codon:yes gene_type:complete
MVLRDYIEDLDLLVDDFEDIVEEIIQDHKGYFLFALKRRLLDKGLDGDLNFLGRYSETHKKAREKKGLQTAKITLRYTGEFFNNMYVLVDGYSVLLDSSAEKTDKLLTSYGDAILEMTEAETQKFIDTILEPELNKIISKLGT